MVLYVHCGLTQHKTQLKNKNHYVVCYSSSLRLTWRKVKNILALQLRLNVHVNIFLGLSKTFDTHDHIILLINLKGGINRVVQKPMESNITSRKHCVEINDTNPATLTLQISALQWSIPWTAIFFMVPAGPMLCSS